MHVKFDVDAPETLSRQVVNRYLAGCFRSSKKAPGAVKRKGHTCQKRSYCFLSLDILCLNRQLSPFPVMISG